MIIDIAEKNATMIKNNESPKLDDCDIDVISISDTIVLTTYSDDSQKALEFHAGICAIMLIDCLKKELFVRGATTYGLFNSSGNILIGPQLMK